MSALKELKRSLRLSWESDTKDLYGIASTPGYMGHRCAGSQTTHAGDPAVEMALMYHDRLHGVSDYGQSLLDQSKAFESIGDNWYEWGDFKEWQQSELRKLRIYPFLPVNYEAMHSINLRMKLAVRGEILTGDINDADNAMYGHPYLRRKVAGKCAASTEGVFIFEAIRDMLESGRATGRKLADWLDVDPARIS